MKKNTWLSFVLISLAALALVSCGGGGGGAGGTSASTGTGTTRSALQYTPNQAAWATFSTKPLASGINTSHDPDGVGWLTPASWQNAQWDGTTTYNPETLTRTQLAAAICPSGDQIRGIREVFYANQPFADNLNPTKAEVDEWHRIAINHVRALVGYSSVTREVKKDYCMFARALWGQERKYTTKWDAKYPGTVGSAYGPCQGGTNPHCGATFLPDSVDQAPYLPAGHPGCGLQAGAEGITSAPKSNIPWSIKWSRAFCGFLASEGFWGGHVGPFFHRETFGFSFWDNNSVNNNNNAILRAKWSGKLMNNLYFDPDGTGTMY